MWLSRFICSHQPTIFFQNLSNNAERFSTHRLPILYHNSFVAAASMLFFAVRKSNYAFDIMDRQFSLRKSLSKMSCVMEVQSPFTTLGFSPACFNAQFCLFRRLQPPFRNPVVECFVAVNG
jgi:hypothetical protein